MRRLVAILVGVAVAVYAAFVAQHNQDPYGLDLMFYRLPEAPLWMLLFAAVLLGSIVTLSLVSWPYLRLRLTVRRQSRRITRLEQEVHGLRTLPLVEEAEREVAPAPRARGA